MESSNIIFVVIVVLISLVLIGVVVNEGFCNCMGTGMKYSTPTFGTLGGYKSNFGWPIGTPYDSFARQMASTSNLNVCAPNVSGANALSCPENSAMRQRSQGTADFGSVLSMKTQSAPVSSHASNVMLQGPDISYQQTYTPERGPGRFGYGTYSGSMASYGNGPSGCGFKLFAGPPYNSAGPAGSFTTPPVQVEGQCGDSQGNNLAIGVM